MDCRSPSSCSREADSSPGTCTKVSQINRINLDTGLLCPTSTVSNRPRRKAGLTFTTQLPAIPGKPSPQRECCKTLVNFVLIMMMVVMMMIMMVMLLMMTPPPPDEICSKADITQHDSAGYLLVEWRAGDGLNGPTEKTLPFLEKSCKNLYFTLCFL